MLMSVKILLSYLWNVLSLNIWISTYLHQRFFSYQVKTKHILSFKTEQAVGALGELSDKSDFSLHAWDSFSQEIRDLSGNALGI